MQIEYAFIIPAYNPDEHLVEVVRSIRKSSSHKIFVIDDGSDEIQQYVFQKLREEINDGSLILLRHAVNMGEGAALKTVFNHILVTFPSIQGVVTLDSDGQHSVQDCLHVLDVLKKDKQTFVLGYRTFSKNIPLKSYIGNHISKSSIIISPKNYR